MSQPTSPDHSAVIEHSEQFLVHLKAAIADPALGKQGKPTDEINRLVEELKSVPPKDRKKLKKESLSGKFRSVVSDFARISPDGETSLGTLSFQQFKPSEWKVRIEPVTLAIDQAFENQYQTDILFTILDGPLEGEQATLSTVGNYSLDDKDPSRQNIGFTKVVLHPEASNGASLDKWKEVMKKENDSMDESGEIVWTAPEPMKAFRDFLYFDDQMQVTIGNRGSLAIIQK